MGAGKNTDKTNSVDLEILVGYGNRIWLEPKYHNKTIRPIGKIRTVIPSSPDDQNALLDACIAFAPKYFAKCPTLDDISKKLANMRTLDFDFKENIPDDWHQLRKEAAPIFEKLPIFRMDLTEMKGDEKYDAL